MSAKVQSGSPGLLGIFTFLPLSNFIISLTETVLPLPTLKICPLIFDLLDLIKAETTSVTYVKSLVCFPLPTTVKGALANFCAKNSKHSTISS